MGLVNYDLSFDPAKPVLSLSIGLTATQLSATATGLQYSLSVKPTTGTIVGGVISGAILSVFTGPAGIALTVGAVYAVADLVKNKITSAVNGKFPTTETYDFDQPIGYSVDVAGVTVKVEAETLSLSTYSGMLMATGTLKVS